MNIVHIEKLIARNGVKHTINRLNVQIEYIKKVMRDTDESTASVLSDVVFLIEDLKIAINPKTNPQ